MKAMLCHICGKKADRTCSMCGRPACSDDIDKASGMCTSCRSGRRAGRETVKKAS